MESNKTAEIIKAAKSSIVESSKGKQEVFSWDIKLDLAKSREVVINPLDHLTVEERVEPRPLSMHLVRSSVIGLSPMEVAALEQYNRPHPEALAWLAQHDDNKDGTPRKYIHSHAIDYLLTNEELATWDKADGWHWSFKYGLAWRKSDGKLNQANPNKSNRLKPYLMDRKEGNTLDNLRIIRAKPEHSYINSAQRKIRKYYREYH